MTEVPRELRHLKALERMGEEERMKRAMLSTDYPILNDLVLLFQELLAKCNKTHIIKILTSTAQPTQIPAIAFIILRGHFSAAPKLLINAPGSTSTWNDLGLHDTGVLEKRL